MSEHAKQLALLAAVTVVGCVAVALRPVVFLPCAVMVGSVWAAWLLGAAGAR